MNAKNIHTFEGFEYWPCTYADSAAQGMRWYRRVQHAETGLFWDERHSPQFVNLRECREDAREQAQHAAIAAESEKAFFEQF